MCAHHSTTIGSAALYTMLAALTCAYPMLISSGNVGNLCQPRSIFCADGEGMSARYFKCIQGRLVEEFCPDPSICVGSKDTTIFCAVDFSQSSLDAPPSSSQSNSTTAGVNSAVAANASSAGSSAGIPVTEITTTRIVPVTATAISNQHIPLQQTSAISQQLFAARSTGGSSARANPTSSPVYLPASFSSSQWTTYMAPQQHTPMPSLQQQQQKPSLPLSSSPLLPTPTNHSQQHIPAYPLQPAAMPSQQPPHVLPMYQPRPNLPLPPALSYNHQQLLAVTTVITHVYARPITTMHAPVVPVTSVVPATRTVLLAPTALLSPFASSAVAVHHISTIHSTRVPIKLNDQVLTIPSIGPSEPVSTVSDKIMTTTAQPSRIGNVDVEQVLSIVGSVLISQQMELSLLDGDELLEHFSTNSDDWQEQQHDIASEMETDVATTLGASTDAAASAGLELSNSTASVNLVDSQNKFFDAITSMPPYLGYVSLSTPAVCKPGQFVCEAHGLRPGFFACDSVGIALPAVCGANEVCYQQGKSILCDAPGKNPKQQL